MGRYDLVVDTDRRRVVATWGRAVTGRQLLEYQKTVWSRSDVPGFDELLDMTALEEVDVSQEDLRAVARLAAAMDESGGRSRCAIVTGQMLHYGLARMYEMLRELQDGSRRQVRVFDDLESARAWLDAPRP